MGCCSTSTAEVYPLDTVLQLNPKEWQTDHVTSWLTHECNGELRGLISVFREHKISGPVFCDLTDEQLKSEMGVKQFGVRSQFVRTRDNLLSTNLVRSMHAEEQTQARNWQQQQQQQVQRERTQSQQQQQQRQREREQAQARARAQSQTQERARVQREQEKRRVQAQAQARARERARSQERARAQEMEREKERENARERERRRTHIEAQRRARAKAQAGEEDKDDDDDENQLSEEDVVRLIRTLGSLAIIEEQGFLFAEDDNKNKLLEKLNRVNCSGQTALRDAVVLAVVKMLKLKAILEQLNICDHQFVHIVLTDGQDTSSECSFEDMAGLFVKLGQELGALCKTFFVGVGLSGDAELRLQLLSKLGGDSAEYFGCDTLEISEVFDHIQVSIGIRKRTAIITDGTNAIIAQQRQAQLFVKQRKFLILFTLDKSGSMAGGRWRRTCQAVHSFLEGVQDTDLIACVTFNNEAELLQIK